MVATMTKFQSILTTCMAFACMPSTPITAFSPSHPSSLPLSRQLLPSPQTTNGPSSSSTSLNLQIDPNHALTSATTFLSTIDSDIASIPDDQFGKVFAGGGLIMLGSILSTVFVGFLLESNGGGYANLVAESYAEQNYGEEGESFLDSLGLSSEEKKETEEMVRAFREKKMKKAGTWTEEDEKKKQAALEENDMFSDY